MALDGIKTYIIGVILGIAVIMSGVFMIGSLSTSDTTLDSTGDIQQFNSTLALSQNITSGVNNIESGIRAPEKAGALGWIDAFFKTAFGGLSTIKNTMGFVGTAATESAGFFHIGGIIPILNVVLLVIVIIMAIAIYEAITRQ